jgi:diguanylate cyclase (GGDEF)-like protein
VLALASALLLTSWMQQRHGARAALGLWGIAFALGGIATALVSGRGQLSDAVSIVAANALLAVSYGTMWSAARVFGGRRVHVLALFAGAGIWLAAMSIPAWLAWPDARVSLIVGIGIVYSLLAAFELWRTSGEGLYSRWLAIGLLVVHAAAMPLRIPVVAGWFGTSPASGNVLSFILLESILLAVAGAYLFGSLVRERIAFGYKQAASLDPLTGVANRRTFFQKGERLVQSAKAEGRPHCGLVFDLDRFKAINDEFGHAAGDAVLERFCAVSSAQLRPGDLFGRIGGEEFACLLIDVSAADALHIAERLRFAFEMSDASAGEPPYGVTVSVGLAAATPEHRDLVSLLHSADRALYRAKKDGRNRVAEVEPGDADAPPVLGFRRA